MSLREREGIHKVFSQVMVFKISLERVVIQVKKEGENSRRSGSENMML